MQNGRFGETALHSEKD